MRLKKTMVGAAAAGLALIAAPASAATVNVAVGSNTSGTHSISATSTNTQFTVLAFGFIPTTMTCSSVGFSGNAIAGSTATVATLSGSTWTTCSYSGGSITPTGNHSTPWSLVATGGYTNGTSDNVTGQIQGVDVDVSVSSPSCSFNVSGAANGTFNESPQTLVVNENAGNLLISGSTCTSMFANGDPASFTGTFSVSSPDGAINVKP